MKTLFPHRARLSACALAAFLLVGCGGGGSSDPAPAARQTETVQMLESPSRLTVVATTPSGSDGSAVTVQWAAMQFAFRAVATGGSNAGLALSGTLLLKSESEGGGTEVEGRLLVGTSAAPGSSNEAAVAALVADMRARNEGLRSAFRTAVGKLRAQLAADLAAATTDAERATAKATFTTAFRALNSQLEADMAAVATAFRDGLAALGITDPKAMGRDDDDEESDSRRGYKVEGTISSGGAVNLEITLGKKSVVRAVGTLAADGSMSGSFSGPASDDAGTWSAAPSGTTPSPSPSPSPTPSPSPSPTPSPSPSPSPSPTPSPPPPDGAALYATNCSGCHGPDPKANQRNVMKTTSVAALDSAIAKVGEMGGLTSLTTAQKTAIVGFITK